MDRGAWGAAVRGVAQSWKGSESKRGLSALPSSTVCIALHLWLVVGSEFWQEKAETPNHWVTGLLLTWLDFNASSSLKPHSPGILDAVSLV